MIHLDALIGIEGLSVLILVIILGFCIVMECRRTKRMPVTVLYIVMLVLELLFIIFCLLRHIVKKNILTTQSLAQARDYYLFRGLSDVAFFLLLIAYILCVVLFLSTRTKFIRFFAVTSIAGCAVMVLMFLFFICFPRYTSIIYYIDLSGSHTGKALFAVSIVVFYITAMMIYLVVKYFNKISKPMLLGMLSFIMCPSLVLVLRFFGFDVNLLSPTTVISFVFMFCFFYMWQVEINRRQQVTIANDRLVMLQNQIRPHFLYNTLNTIYILCGKDPKAAQSAISNFSEYMRANLESLEGVSLIPLDQELENVECYLELEKMRFGDDIEIEYDIDFVDTAIPPMAVQVLAENAVKHGIGNKASGCGRVVIRTRRTEGADLIIVEDNGAGFDVSELGSGADAHFGIRNVRERLRQLLGATLSIESEIGKATVATIRIPRNKRSASAERKGKA